MIQKIKTILKSRFKKVDEDFVKQRRRICKNCEYNSKNIESIDLKKRFLIYLSDLYTKITFSKSEKLGNCMACEACDIYYKTQEIEENCVKNKWRT